jgi:NitT/TauT family transport system permease protein
MKRSLRYRLAPAFGLVMFFGIWELYVRIAKIGSYKLVQPSKAFAEVWKGRATYWANALPTFRVAMFGFAIAMVVAFVVASLIAQSRTAERAVLPVALLVVVTPLFAYAQAILIWIGLGVKSLVVMVAIVCFPPMLFAATTGLKSVDLAATELLRSVNASRWEIFRKLQVPTALPQLLSAAKLSAGLSLVGVTIGEPYAFAGDQGLGLLIRRTASAGNVAIPQLWGSIFVLGFIGSFAYLAISGIETVVRRWHSLDNS